MKYKGLRILLVSSRPPEHSAGLGASMVKALQDNGCAVDFLSLYPSTQENDFTVFPVLAQPPRATGDITHNVGRFARHVKDILHPMARIAKNIIFRFSKKRKMASFSAGSGFVYPDESSPAINPKLLLAAIPPTAEYDLIVTLFWQNMLNSTSLRALFHRFNAPVYIFAVDMAPITGGCFYFNSCVRYKSGCGQCPCLMSDDPQDRSHTNYLTKESNYSNMQVYYLGNSWMIERALASRLFNEGTVLNMGMIIDETIFSPHRSPENRQRLNIPCDKDIVLLVRSSDAKRKGADIIVYAAEYLQAHLPAELAERICWLAIGDRTLKEEFAKKKIALVSLGYVNLDTLVTAYRESSLFLNPSTDDAGPSMVNQSIMCGTPVVSFNLGTAVDVIKNGISGFKTDDISAKGFAVTLEGAIRALTDRTYPDLSESTRATALRHNTSAVFADKLLSHFDSGRHGN